MNTYECKFCKRRFTVYGDKHFDEIEEDLWGHIQMEHEVIFENIENLDTPDMLEIAYACDACGHTESSN